MPRLAVNRGRGHPVFRMSAAIILGFSIIVSGAGLSVERVQQRHPEEALIARAKAFELDTPYVPPPGDPLEHHTSGYAKTMCSAVFITGLNPEIAAENVGFFTGPYEQRKKVGKPTIDRARKEISITMPNGVPVVARQFASQGCSPCPQDGTMSSSNRLL